MNKIELTVASRWLYVFHYAGSALIAGILTVLILKFILDINQLIFLIFFGGIWYLLNHFTKTIPRGKVQLEIKENGLQINWINQIFLHNRKNQIIFWEEIRDYMYQPEQYFNLLRIRTRNQKYKFSMVGENDSFPFFYEKLEEVIQSKSEDNSIKIKRVKNIYESKYGLFSAIFMGLFIIVGLIAFIFIEPKGNSEPNYGLLIASLVGGIFFIWQVIIHRKNDKNGG